MHVPSIKPIIRSGRLQYIEVAGGARIISEAQYDYNGRSRLPPTPLALDLYRQKYPEGHTTPYLQQWQLGQYLLRKKLNQLRGDTRDIHGVPGLWDWQKSAIRFILDRKRVLLADQMGTGKTVTALGAVTWWICQEVRRIPHVLILCPRHKIVDWEEAVDKWVKPDPFFPVIAPRSSNERKIATTLFKDGFFITNWEGIWASPELQKFNWDWVICDEAHRAKSRKSKRTRALMKLRTEYMLLLTGTPVERAAHDLWAQLKILDPDGFPSYWAWVYEFCELGGHPQYPKPIRTRNLPLLWDMLQPYYLRRTRAECFGLDDPTVEIVRVPLESVHMAYYNKVKTEALQLFDIDSATGGGLFVKLAQCATHPTIAMETDLDIDTGKLAYAADTCASAIEQGERPVVFCTFRRTVDHIVDLLMRRCLKVAWFMGGVSTEDIHEAIQSFKRGDADVLVSTTASGSEGTDLPEATLMIFVEIPWSSLTYKQARDRMMRPRADVPHVMLLVAKSTVDERIAAVVAAKNANASRTVVSSTILADLLEEARARKS